MNPTQKRNIALLVSGRLISLVGSGIQSIAIPLYILQLTGSGTMMGIFTLAWLVPMLICAPFAGVLGDRLNRKHLMIIPDYARGLLIGALAFIATLNVMSIPILLVMQVLVSIMDSLFNAASDGILPDLASKDSLPKVNAAKGSADAAAMIAGPVLGGIIFGLAGITVIFIINAASFILSAILETSLKYRKTTADKGKMSLSSFVHEIGQAVKFIGKARGIKILFTFALVLNFLVNPIFQIVMPYITTKTIGFSSQQYGFLLTGFMAGVLMGNLFAGGMYKKMGAEKLMKQGMLGQCIFFAIIAAAFFPFIGIWLGGASWSYFAVLTGILFFIGFLNAWVNMPLQVNMQKMVPAEMRSRFYSILMLFIQAAVPVSSMVYGLLLDHVMPHIIIAVVVGITLVLTVGFVIKAPKEVYGSGEADNPGQGEALAVQPAE
jgi:MFS transporter, DHA3 family, macrolide efflux protein